MILTSEQQTRIVSSENCVESLEDCHSFQINQLLLRDVRPDLSSLIILDAIFWLNVLLLPGARKILKWPQHSIDSSDNAQMVTFIWQHTLVWLLPAISIVFYILDDQKFLDLFSFINFQALSQFFIEHGLPDLSLTLHILTSFNFWYLYHEKEDSSADLYLTMALVYTLVASGLEVVSWLYGVDSIRYIDPSWRYHGRKEGILLPMMFSIFVEVEDDFATVDDDTNDSLDDSTFVDEDDRMILYTL